jgi:hypothetical protein
MNCTLQSSSVGRCKSTSIYSYLCCKECTQTPTHTYAYVREVECTSTFFQDIYLRIPTIQRIGD